VYHCTNAPLVKQLHIKYPIGADSHFPNKQVYTSEGRSWELNDMRLQVWAVHLVRIHSSSKVNTDLQPIRHKVPQL